MDYNTRYLAYCRAHSKTPDEMLESDQAHWPGGCMAGYILWVRGKWADFHAQFGKASVKTVEIHRAFDDWLNGMIS